MALPIQSANSPVDQYYGLIENLGVKVRTYAPFTFLAYNSLLPTKSDDLIGLACKVSYFVTLKFYISIIAKSFSPIVNALFYLPFILDGLWLLSNWLQGKLIQPIEAELEEGNFNPSRTLAIVAVAAAAIHFFHKNLPNGP